MLRRIGIILFFSIVAGTLLPHGAQAADPPVKKRLSTLIRRDTSLIVRLAAPKSPGHLDIFMALIRNDLNDLILDIKAGSASVPKAAKEDILSLLSTSKDDMKTAISIDRRGGEPDQVSVALQRAEHLLQLALDLLKFKNSECEIDAEYHLYQDSFNQYPRDEIYVQCNRKWNSLEVTPVSAGLGDIASIWRNYSRTEHPNPYPGGSTSCQNKLSSATCNGYLAAAGGYGVLALGIYNNTGIGAQFHVAVYDRSGKILDEETVTAD